MSALREVSCTDVTRPCASRRRSVVGPLVGSTPAQVSCYTQLKPISVIFTLGWVNILVHPTDPQLLPSAACTDSTGVPRALGETWNSSLSGCSQQQCQAPDTVVPVELHCPGPQPESCPRFGEVILLLPTQDPCCLSAVCGEPCREVEPVWVGASRQVGMWTHWLTLPCPWPTASPPLLLRLWV